MKKISLTLISILLIISMTFPIISVCASENDEILSVNSVEEAVDILKSDNKTKTASCDGKCGNTPLIIVPGIMQSQVYVQDEKGNDLLTVDGFPIVEGMDMTFMIDTEKIVESVPKMIFALLKSLLLFNKKYVLDEVMGVLSDSFKSHNFNPDSTRVNDVKVDEYWYSLEECMKRPEKSYNYAKGYTKDENGKTLPTTKYVTEYDFIKRQVDIDAFCNVAGYDHTYYFAYSSFGDTLEIAKKFDEYIDMVKEQTGHDKVSIVFISLGGTIGNTYLAEYYEKDEIDRIIFAAAALNGSDLLGDLMEGCFTTDDTDVVYNKLIPEIMPIAKAEKWYGFAANILLRFIPKSIIKGFLNDALQRLMQDVLHPIIVNCPSMWALVPSERYPELSKKYISDEAHKKLKEKTDKYYNIQVNAKNNLKKLVDEGLDAFIICGYNLPLPSACDSFMKSSDNIIQTSSESLGANATSYGYKLPDDYKPAIDSSYISPDRNLDAGTGALPDRTWYIKNQSHLSLQSSVNDVIGLCVNIVLDKSIKDARKENGGYPQFNEYRDLSVTEKLLYKYLEINNSSLSLSKEQKSRLDSAYNNLLGIYNSRVWNSDETLNAEKELYTVMYELSLLPDYYSQKSPKMMYDFNPAMEKSFSIINAVLYYLFGNSDVYSK